MPDDIKISALTNVNTLSDTAVFPMVQDLNGTDTTLKASMSQVAGKVAEGTTFVNLTTTAKDLVGAINEAASTGGSVDITTEITTPAAIQSFNDGGDNIPLKSLLLELPESESGYGDVSIAVTSEFLYDENDITEGYYVDSNGELQPVGVWNATDYIPVSGSRIYYWGIQTTGTAPYSAWYDENKQFISSFKQEPGAKYRIIPANARYVRFSIYQNDISRFQCALNKVSTLINLGETLTQGGTLEVVSGLLTRTDETTSQITGTNINTRSGVNNIYQTRGDVLSLEYFNENGDDIDSLVDLEVRLSGRIRTKTYTGDGSVPLVVTFDEVPTMILNIFGNGQGSQVICFPFVYGLTSFGGVYVTPNPWTSPTKAGGGHLLYKVAYSNGGKTMTVRASADDAGAQFNQNGDTYTIYYLV